MEKAGIRELKENMSRYMKRVRAGERVLVTHRKKKIAILMPLKGALDRDKMHRLIQSGKASWSGGKPRGIHRGKRTVMRGKSLAEAVIEDRR